MELQGLQNSPSPFRRSDRPFLRLAASTRSDSASSVSFVSFSRWLLRVAAPLCFLALPFAAALAFDSSSEAGWDAELLCLEREDGDGELVRCLFAVCLLLYVWNLVSVL